MAGELLRSLRSGGVRAPPSLGNSISTILLVAAIVAFFVCIALLWIHRERGAGRADKPRVNLGMPPGLATFPRGSAPRTMIPGPKPTGGEPPASCGGGRLPVRVSIAGARPDGPDSAGPGRTGRYDVQSLRDRELIDAVGATLGLFEDVYYGRNLPTAGTFESVWLRALAFQEPADLGRGSVAMTSRSIRDRVGVACVMVLVVGFAGCGPSLEMTYGKSRGQA